MVFKSSIRINDISAESSQLRGSCKDSMISMSNSSAGNSAGSGAHGAAQHLRLGLLTVCVSAHSISHCSDSRSIV